MRKNKLLLSLAVIASLVLTNKSHAQSTLIHYWNFNSLSFTTVYTPTVVVVPPDYSDLPATAHPGVVFQPLLGTSSAYYTYIENFTSSTTDYDTVNLRMGATAGNYIRLHNPSDSMEFLLYTPSTNFHNLKLTFGTSRPVNGMMYQNYDYSTDSGSTWITTGLSRLTDTVASTFAHVTLTCTNAAVNDNPKLVFRIKWTGDTAGTAGNNRFDNITLDGDTTTSTSVSSISVEPYFFVYPNPVANTLDIHASLPGAKQIRITNMLGQTVYEDSKEGSQFSVSTVALRFGYYFIHITDLATGNTSSRKFLKM